MSSWRRMTLLAAVIPLVIAAPALADHTPPPQYVTLPGSFQTELGCPGDWQPDCTQTDLAYDNATDTWRATFDIPAGSWEFKVAINHAWDENYGQSGQQNGPNIPLVLAQQQSVTFIYSHHTHVVSTSAGRTVVAAGSFQSELGCPGDWQPECAASQLFDPENDQTYVFATNVLPPGFYEFKIAIGFSWNENYGEGGVPNGSNIPFTIDVAGSVVTFTYSDITHVPTVTVEAPTATAPSSWGRLKQVYR